MKRRIAVIGATLAGVCLGACHHHSNSAPPASQQQALDTNGVLQLAQKTSDTGTPFAVNDGAVQITDTSETADPVSLNGM